MSCNGENSPTVAALCERRFFLESMKYRRSQTAATVDSIMKHPQLRSGVHEYNLRHAVQGAFSSSYCRWFDHANIPPLEPIAGCTRQSIYPTVRRNRSTVLQRSQRRFD